MRFLSYYLDVKKAYYNQKHTPPLVYHILTLKATHCDAYTRYPESHYGVLLHKNVTKMHDTQQHIKKLYSSWLHLT